MVPVYTDPNPPSPSFTERLKFLLLDHGRFGHLTPIQMQYDL
ncbi:hypothetical protein HanIR_Chr14g0715021 [Helianthus annuus]|nr:hypothetical protein HanIR_Chr14g0715021 [Helianthus annuus]